MTAASAPLPVSRRERRKLEVRGRIIEAAAELIGEQGFAATTVEAICERADVARKTFFNHFPAKADVVGALAAESIEELLEHIAEASRTGRNTAARLRIFFDGVVTHAADAGPMHRELVTEVIRAAQQAPDEPEQARRLHAAMADLVRTGVAEGDITDAHPIETLTETILGTYYALMFSLAHLDDYPIDRRARAAARFLAEALTPRTKEA